MEYFQDLLRATTELSSGSSLLVLVTVVIVTAVSVCLYAINRTTASGSRGGVSGTGRIGKVSRILVYPLKSCRSVQLEEGMCLKQGFEYDRRWVVVNMESSMKPEGVAGVAVTMANCPKLAQIQPQIGHSSPRTPGKDKEVTLTLCAEGMPDITMSTSQMLQGRTDAVYSPRVSCQAYDCGDNASQWLCSFLERPSLRLYYMATGQAGRVMSRDAKWGSLAKAGDVASFASFTPYLVCTEQSLKDISSRMECNLEIERFRPNIVVDCPGMEPYAEDSWQRFSLGSVEFRFVKACGRCPIIMQDPSTGKSNARGLLPKLREFRLNHTDERHGNAPIFGLQVAADTEGMISVNDVLTVL
eukprot:scpid55228/ scgid12805/ MOSC domain-containing protein 1, mitochondrial; Mitochondrial amidoxime reducing component 1; Moco sulfurase C-terminal domain-containing protein 1; Molybdenum cofactor sulfurase C-terminal domain-containing protein 1